MRYLYLYLLCLTWDSWTRGFIPTLSQVPIRCQGWATGAHGYVGISFLCSHPVSLIVRPAAPILEQALSRKSPVTAVLGKLRSRSVTCRSPTLARAMAGCQHLCDREVGLVLSLQLKKSRLRDVEQPEGDGTRATTTQHAHFPPHTIACFHWQK